MRPIGIGLAIALIAAVVAPGAAFAAKPAAPPAVSKENRDRGMKDAPGVVAASGMDCQVADARFIGEGADPKTKKKTGYYELACTGGEGLVVAKSDVTTTYTCLETAVGPDGKPSNLSCILPANANANAGLAPYLIKGGVNNCDIANARALGRSDKSVVFEAACKNGDGYIIIAGNPPRADGAVEVNPCLGYDENSSMACKLSDRAALLSVVDRLTPAIGKPCTVANRGYIGVTQQKHENLYEVACKEGKGYILVQKPDGTLDSAIDCGATDMCKMTDARQAQTEQAGLYTKLARKAGFECDVDRYFPFPARGGIDAVCRAAQRQFAQGQQVRLAEEALGRRRGLVREVDAPRLQAREEIIRGQVDQLDLVGLVEDAVRQGFLLAHPGDAGNHVAEALEVLHVDGGPDADAGLEQFLDVLPALRMPRSRLALQEV